MQHVFLSSRGRLWTSDVAAMPWWCSRSRIISAKVDHSLKLTPGGIGSLWWGIKKCFWGCSHISPSWRWKKMKNKHQKRMHCGFLIYDVWTYFLLEQPWWLFDQYQHFNEQPNPWTVQPKHLQQSVPDVTWCVNEGVKWSARECLSCQCSLTEMKTLFLISSAASDIRIESLTI